MKLAYASRSVRHTVMAFVGYALIMTLLLSWMWYPEPQLFLNPEYGGSDVSHFNIPVRYFYDKALGNGEVPLWSQHMGSGFPIYAESQMGAFYIPNLLLYGALPFWIAFNLSYIASFLIGAMGMFALVNRMVHNAWSAWFAGAAFMLSGYLWGHTNHINMIQTASLVPWILLLYFFVIESKHVVQRVGFFAALSLIISQQLLAGHMQTSFITGFMVTLFAGYECLGRHYRKCATGIATIISAFVVAAILAAVQILPSYELHSQSVRSDPLSPQEVMHFSADPSSLLTVVHPFVLGHIRDASYIFLDGVRKHGVVFWESLVYLGVGACLAMMWARLKNGAGIYWMISAVGILLMLGRHSPLYIIFSAPPFNYFTTPARFLLMFVVAGSVLVGIGLSRMSSLWRSALGIALVAQGVVAWYGYGVSLPVTSYMVPPETAQYILKDDTVPPYEKRIYPFVSNAWTKELVEHGWERGDGYAEYFNELAPNMSSLWGIASHREYVGRIWTARKYLYDQQLAGLFDVKNEPRRILAERLMNMASIDYVTSVTDPGPPFTRVYERTASKGVPAYAMYHNPSAKPRMSMTDDVHVVTTVEDVFDGVLRDDHATESAYLEKLNWWDTQPNTPLAYNVEVVRSEDRHLEMKTRSNKEAIFVIADLYYPGWQVHIDNEPVEYFPANIIQRAVVVPKGEHTIRMAYKPRSFEIGAWVSLLAHVIVIPMAFLPVLTGRRVSSATH